MRLKKNAANSGATSGGGATASNRMNDANNDLNGSTSSNSSVSNNNGIDDLDMDSGDVSLLIDLIFSLRYMYKNIIYPIG